jgi:hypothetical protein
MSMDDGNAPYYRKTIPGETRSCQLCLKKGDEKCKVYFNENCDEQHICDSCETQEDFDQLNKKPEAYTPGVIKYSDADNADRFIKNNGQNIKFCVEEEKFYIWTGQAWEQDIKNLTGSMIKQMMDKLRLQEEDNYNEAVRGKEDAVYNKENKNVIEQWDKAISTTKSYLKKLTTSGAFDNTMRRCQRDYSDIKIKLTDFDKMKGGNIKWPS